MSYKLARICLSFSLSLISLLFCRPATAQYSFDGLDQLFKQNQKFLGNNYAALVWKDGKIIYSKQATVDFTAKMPAPIANAGNWMTAALVMTFVDEGKLSLDDKVTKYIPIFGKYMKGFITIRNCLTSTTGIQASQGEPLRAMERSKYASLEEEVESYATKRDIVTNPGTEFYYSNVGINIAARVLEVVSKKSFDRLMKDRILNPCKMKGTSFSNEDGGAVNAASGARSTANDYIAFLSMLLNKGMFGDRKVLSEAAIAEMEKMQLVSLPVKYSPNKITPAAHYGLGNWITDGEGETGAGSFLSCPSFLTTTAFADKCRGYAAVLIVLKPEEEQKKPIYLSMKEIIEQQLPCK